MLAIREYGQSMTGGGMEIRLLVLLAVLSFAVPAAADSPAAACRGESCRLVADQADWPAAKDAGSLVLNTEHYSLHLPGNPTKIATVGTIGLLNIRYGDGSKYIVTTRNRRDDRLFSYLPASTTLADFLRFVYTGTPEEPPGNSADRATWHIAMSQKTVFMNKVISARIFRKGTMTVYYIERSGPFPYRQSAYLVDTHRPDEYLDIGFRNFETGEALGVIGSIEPRE